MFHVEHSDAASGNFFAKNLDSPNYRENCATRDFARQRIRTITPARKKRF